MSDWAILILRVSLGVMFMAHGLQKAFGLFAGPGLKGFAEFISTLGFSPALPWAALAAYTELIGGICVALGIYSRAASTFLFILICVAGIKVHISKGFFLMQGGFEYVFIIAAICLSLILSGPGKFSLMPKL